MKIGIITAMDIERKLTAALLDNRSESTLNHHSYTIGSLADHEIFLTDCGIGKVNAAIGAMEMISAFRPDFILNTGVAGGLSEQLNPMDIVVGSRVAYHDVWCGEGNEWGQVQGLPLYFAAPDRLLQAALSSATSDQPLHAGLICTGDQFIASASQLGAIRERFPDALACDMESAAIAHACLLNSVSFLSLRIISDVPGEHDRFSQYENFFDTMAERSFKAVARFLRYIGDNVHDKTEHQ